METEIEAKFLEINPDEFREKFKRLHAVLVHAERLMRRRVFDYPDLRLEKSGGWVRVRDEGDKITLAYKQLNDRTLFGTKEITVEVSDFQKAGVFLRSIGLIERAYQETKREKWMLGDTEVTIDTWPWIPTFIEIEAASEEKVKTTVSKLGLDWKKAMHRSVETAYQNYYDVTEQEINSWKSVTFIPVPEWLEVKRKK